MKKAEDCVDSLLSSVVIVVAITWVSTLLVSCTEVCII